MAGRRIADFDKWQGGFAAATVAFYIGSTTALASLYADEAQTVPVANPVVLLERYDGDGYGYGKFAQPIYISGAYSFVTNSVDRSGVDEVPILTLAGEIADHAIAKPRASGLYRELTDHVGKEIHAADYGQLGVTATQNTATLQAAIGQAAAQGGGRVIMPPGHYQVTQASLPAGVVVRGQGKDVTFLESVVADRVFTIAGAGAGFEDITIDGIQLQVLSVGIYGDNLTRMVMNRVIVKRFETGIQARGGTDNIWNDLSISTCSTGLKAYGDINAAGGNTGGEWFHNTWNGGTVSLNLQFGIDIGYQDRRCTDSVVRDVFFDTNTGSATAVRLQGARFTTLDNCRFVGNGTNFDIRDSVTSTTDDFRKVSSVRVRGSEIRGGSIRIQDTSEDIIFDTCSLSLAAAWVLTLPQQIIQRKDCLEDSTVTITGDSTKLTSVFTTDDGQTVGITTDGTATKAWASPIVAAGQILHIEAIAIGNGRNVIDHGEYKRFARFRRAGSTLAYQAQTVNFTLGQTLTGQTSGATARILADADAGATGTLTIRAIAGTFVSGELLTDGAGGSATANGAVVAGALAVVGAVETIGTDRETVAGWDFTLAATVDTVEARVTGAAATIVEWTVRVTVTYG